MYNPATLPAFDLSRLARHELPTHRGPSARGLRLRITDHVSRFMRAALVSLGLLAVTLLSGCAAHLEVLPSDGQAAAPAPPAATAVPQEHALGLAGIDFDPPMDESELSPAAFNAGITVMVAVANQGSSDEQDVQVRAVLVDPAAAAGNEALLDETHALPTLRSGEVGLARFTHFGALPYRPRYQLRVFVQPVPGELNQGDNYRSYDIVVANQ